MDKKINVHYLRHNKNCSSPHKFCVVDTETDNSKKFQEMTLWCMIVELRHKLSEDGEPELSFKGKTGDELADVIEQLCEDKVCLWVYFHNSNFDLSTTQLPPKLVARGWTVTKQALCASSPWLMLKKGAKHIRLLDSFSVLPRSVKFIASSVNLKKTDLPSKADKYELWETHCHMDALIVARALLQCMEWWDKEQLGNWSITGTSTGWNVFLHKKRRVKITIEQDAKARAFERLSLMGGKREAYKLGHLMGGPFANFDFVSAHANICKYHLLPYKRAGHFDSLPTSSRLVRMTSLGIIAKVKIKSDREYFPVRTNTGVYYPVGEFSTVLCGPEIIDAKEHNELMEVNEGYYYKMAPIMHDWATWVLDVLQSDSTPPAVRIMAKGWSHSVPGKWASRTSKEISRREYPCDSWEIIHGVERTKDGYQPLTITRINKEEIWSVTGCDSDDCFPAVLSYIQSYCRLLLNNAMSVFNGCLIQCNTDGFLCDINKFISKQIADKQQRKMTDGEAIDISSAILDENRSKWAPLTLRTKTFTRDIISLGAQHLVIGGERRLSGVPSNAIETTPNVFDFTTWPRLSSQINKVKPAGYLTVDKKMDLNHLTVNRWRCSNGSTFPVTCVINDRDSNEFIKPWIQIKEPKELAPKDEQAEPLRKLLL
jgi:hypothetical protein